MTCGPPVPFIVGAGRSGNTLLRLMLDAHPDLAIPPETDFIPELATRCAGPDDARAAFLGTVTGHWRFTDLGVEATELERRVGRLEPFSLGAGLRTLYRLYAEKFGKSRFGDKTPFYLDHMGLVERLLPEAHFIHMIRDGRDVAVSIRPLWFGPNSIRAAAGWWRDTVERGRAAGQSVRHYVEVRFEDLVLETEPTLRRVCEFIELPWHPAMLAYHERAAERIGEVRREGRGNRGEVVATVAQRRAIHRATGDPPRPDRIGRWRHELSAWERRLFEWRCRELLESLGYR